MRSFTWMYLAAATTMALLVAPRTSGAEVTLADEVPSWGVPHGAEFWKAKAADGVDFGAAIERVEHAFRAHESRVEATSAGYRAALSADGTSLRFGPATLRIGTRAVRASDAVLARASAEPWVVVGNTAQRRLQGNRGIVEHLEARADGVELSWILPSQPAREPLTIDVALEGMEFDLTDDAGHRLLADGARLRIGHAVAVDNAGRRWELRSALRAGTLQVQVPDSVLAEATYPLAIDPTFGPEFELDHARVAPQWGYQGEPAVAGIGNNFFVAWESGLPVDSIYGARIDRDGRVLDPGGVLLCTECTNVDVAYLGGNFVAVWIADTGRVLGRRIGLTTGVPEAGVLVLGPAAGVSSSVSIASSSTHLAVAHAYKTISGISEVRVELVEADGTVVRTLRSSLGGFDYLDPDIDSTGNGWSIAFVTSSYMFSAVQTIRANADLTSHSQIMVADWSFDVEYRAPSVAAAGSQSMMVWTEIERATNDSAVRATLQVGTSPAPPSFPIAFDTIKYGRRLTDVVSTLNEFWVAWVDDYGDERVKLRPYSRFGVPLSSPIAVQHEEPAPSDLHGGESPSLWANGDYVLAAWADFRDDGKLDVYATRMVHGELLDQPNIVVSGDDEAYLVQQREPAIAAAEHAGYYLVAWSDTRHGDEDIIAAFLDKSGYLLTPGGMNLSNSPGVRDLAPAVASDGKGFFVAWHARGGGPATSHVIGSRVDKPGPVGVGHGTAPGVGFEISGNVHGSVARKADVTWNGSMWFVAWEDTLPGVNNTINGRFLKADWHTNWLDPLLDLSQSTAYQWDVAVASIGSEVVAVWNDWRPGSLDSNNVFATVVKSNGLVESPIDITKADDDSFGLAQQERPAIAVSDSDRWMVTYTVIRPGVTDVHGTLMEGLSILHPFKIAAGPYFQRHSSVAWSKDQYLVAWEDESARYPKLHYRRFDWDAMPLSAEFSHPTKRGTSVALAGMDGNWMVAYESPVGGAPLVWGMPVTP